MDIPGEDGKILVFIHEDAFVTALVKVTYAVMPSIVIAGIGNIELAHEFGKIAFWGLHEQMEVIGHEDVTVKFD
jgi:hypothetical protein